MELLRLEEAAAALAEGRTTSRALTEACLAEIEKPDGEGKRAFITLDREGALAQAAAMDGLRAVGAAPSPWAGIPIAVKDLFDLKGQVTTAGSRALADQPAAADDAPAMARLRQAGLVLLGRNNMTEFAYSGLGLNPHYGTPKNPFDRALGRVPGGSSSGAAVAVADGMALGAIGSDTSGSCRIPAAFCGITGFKPTQARVPLGGAAPLSYSLDSIGPLARSVSCCAILDSLLAGEARVAAQIPPLGTLRLAVLRNYVLEDMDAVVSRAFETALQRLSAAGAGLVDLKLPEIEELPAINAKGGLAGAESYHWHRPHMERAGDLYDPRVLSRIKRGAEQSAVDYLDVLAARRRLIASSAAKTSGFDAVVYPTVPIVAPTFDALKEDADYYRINLLVLRNSLLGNFLDRCAISLPLASEGAPVGLTLLGERGGDAALLAKAAVIEGLLAQ